MFDAELLTEILQQIDLAIEIVRTRFSVINSSDDFFGISGRLGKTG